MAEPAYDLSAALAAAEYRAEVAEQRIREAELRAMRAETHVALAEARAKRLSEVARRFRTLVANLPDTTVVVFDRELRYQVVEGAGTAATGWKKANFEGRHLRDLFPEDVAGSLERLYRRTLAGESSTENLQHGERAFVVHARPLRDDDGVVTAGMVMSQDVTVLKRTEDALRKERAALRRTLDEREVLLQEVYHRVKNNLQVVSSLLSLQARALDDPTAKSALHACKGRVGAMARAHEKLYQSDNLSQIDLGAYLADLAQDLESTYSASRRVKLQVETTPIASTLERCIPLGLIAHELIANAYQHGFTEGRSGTVWLRLYQTGDELVLQVQDDGVGCPPNVGKKRLGLKLLHSLSTQVGGTLAMVSEPGTLWTLRLPKLDQA